MKSFLNILVIALVTTAPQLGEATRASSSPLAQAPVKATEAVIRTALPELGQVFFKNGSTSSGRVIAIDSQKLSLQRNSTTSIPLSEVDRVVFSKNALVYKTDGRQFHRGNVGAATPIQQIWKGISLNAFRLQDPIRGQAEVKLGPPVVSRLRLQGIVSVAQDKTYVVDEIQFDRQNGTMTIKATPY